MTRTILLISFLALVAAACGSADSGDGRVDDGASPPTTTPVPPPGDAPGDKEPARYDKIPDNAGAVSITSFELLIMESFPIQVNLSVEGSLPTPCHGLGWVDSDNGSTIAVTVFSIEPGPAVSCITVEEPFSLRIPLGSFANEARTVTLNGEVVGEFTS